MNSGFADFVLNYATPVDPTLQAKLEAIDAALRERFGMQPEHTAVGVLDLNTSRLALVRPDKIDYAASVPKIAILLAWFAEHPAAKFSQQIGLRRIQEVLDAHGFYDAAHGGGIWMGKHYGKSGERVVDPVGGHSHAITVRQVLRFYLLLEQGKLVSPAASRTMREIFASPEIAHREDKFVKGLAGRGLEVRRKAGWWETWFHDSAVVTGGGRHYIVVAMTHHTQGDAFLEAFSVAVDDVLRSGK